MVKVNKNILFTVLLGSVLLISSFYWFQVRPSKIRQECSWNIRHINAIPAVPSKSESELRNEGMLPDCTTGTQWEWQERCKKENNALIEKMKNGIPAQAAKDLKEPTSKADYDFCIRSKGLTR